MSKKRKKKSSSIKTRKVKFSESKNEPVVRKNYFSFLKESPINGGEIEEKFQRIIDHTLNNYITDEDRTYISSDTGDTPSYFFNKALCGDVKALYNLGLCYIMGIGTKKDAVQSFEFIFQSAEEGYIEANYTLGEYYQGGIGTKKDYNKACECYKKAYEAGKVDGSYKIAELYYLQGKLDESIEWLEKSFNEGNTDKFDALFLGALYEEIGNQDKAFIWFKKSVELGEENAYAPLGRCYMYGLGTEKDVSKALVLLNKSIELNLATPGVYDILGYYYAFESDNEEDRKKGFNYVKKLDGEDDSFANMLLGHMYYAGIGTDKDELQAFSHIQKCLQKNDYATFDAKIRLGYFYEQGIGCKQDTLKSLEYYVECFNIDPKQTAGILDYLRNVDKIDKTNNYFYAKSIKDVLKKLSTIQEDINVLNDKGEMLIYGQQKILESIKDINSSLIESKKEFSKKLEHIQSFLDEENEYMNWFKNQSEKMILLSQDSRFNIENIQEQLKNSFGYVWESLDNYTQKSLLAARAFLDSIGDLDAELIDYSGVVICATSAFEKELRKRFFDQYKIYLYKNFSNNYEKWPNSMLYKGSLSSIFTLGSLPSIFGSVQLSNDGLSNKKIELSNKDKELLLLYLKTFPNNNIYERLLQSNNEKSSFLDRCEKIRLKYRNSAAHTDPISFDVANECCNEILGITKEQAKGDINEIEGMILELINITG